MIKEAFFKENSYFKWPFLKILEFPFNFFYFNSNFNGFDSNFNGLNNNAANFLPNIAQICQIMPLSISKYSDIFPDSDFRFLRNIKLDKPERERLFVGLLSGNNFWMKIWNNFSCWWFCENTLLVTKFLFLIKNKYVYYFIL